MKVKVTETEYKKTSIRMIDIKHSSSISYSVQSVTVKSTPKTKILFV